MKNFLLFLFGFTTLVVLVHFLFVRHLVSESTISWGLGILTGVILAVFVFNFRRESKRLKNRTPEQICEEDGHEDEHHLIGENTGTVCRCCGRRKPLPDDDEFWDNL